MNINKNHQMLVAGALVLSLTACSTFKGPRPIDPNDDKQFENLPPAPAVEALPEAKKPAPAVAEAPASEEASAPALTSEAPAEAPETGSASLGNNIEQSAIITETPVATVTPTASAGNESYADLLKIRIFYFGTNLSDIGALSYGGLNAHAKYLTGNPQAKLQISGHTDERGTREYNLALGERRANAVARYLVGAGVNPAQLTVVSYGKEKPAVEGSNEEAWAKCRRVEIDYVSLGNQ